MFDQLAASKMGRQIIVAYTTSVKKIKINPPNKKKMTFKLYATTDVRIRQGNKDVTAATVLIAGRYVATREYPLTIESEQDAYLSIVADSSGGNLEIVCISSTENFSIDDPAT